MNRKLSHEDVSEIRRRSIKERQADLAKEYNVSQATISRIASGKSFTDHPEPSEDYLRGFNDGYEAALEREKIELNE
jgi:transcriptional regulator with XRE-family HTH domain